MNAGRWHNASYWALAALAVALCAAYAVGGLWFGDFWEHAAVVRELADEPWHPAHPLLALAAPHPFVSPYHLALGLVARLTGVSHITVLGLAGALNVLLVAASLRRFVVRLLDNGVRAAPYALLLLLFVWGHKPWAWSGFLDWCALGYVASYPSTFAAGLTLLALSLYIDALRGPRVWPLAAVAPLAALCMVVHPLTSVALLAGLAALLAGFGGPNWPAQVALLGGTIAVAVGVALAWPYFSLADLVTNRSAEFDEQSAALYAGALGRAWAALALLPLSLLRLRRARRDPLVLAIAACATLYLVGGLSGLVGVGRIIAWVVLFGQIGAAAWLAEREERLGGRRKLVVPVAAAVVAVLFVLAGPSVVGRLREPGPRQWVALAGVLAPVGAHEVVLARAQTSWMVPALAGRVVSSIHPLYWIGDHDERRAATAEFFRAQTSDDRRRDILARYGVRWLVLDRDLPALSASERQRITALGRVAAQNDAFTLVATGGEPPLAPPNAGAASQR